MHHDRRDHTEASEVGSVGHDECEASNNQAVAPRGNAYPPRVKEERHVLSGPQEGEHKRGSNRPETCFESRQCVTSPTRFFTERLPEKRRVVVDTGRDQDAPVQCVRIDNNQRGKHDVRKDDEETPECRHTDGSRPRWREPKCSVSASCKSMYDDCGCGRPEGTHDGELQREAKKNYRSHDQPGQSVGEKEEKHQGTLGNKLTEAGWSMRFRFNSRGSGSGVDVLDRSGTSPASHIGPTDI